MNDLLFNKLFQSIYASKYVIQFYSPITYIPAISSIAQY